MLYKVEFIKDTGVNPDVGEGKKSHKECADVSTFVMKPCASLFFLSF